jgi:hypothetical protein
MVSFERNDRRLPQSLRTSSSEPSRYLARYCSAGRVAWKAQYLEARSLPQFYGSAVDKLRGLADRLLIVNALDHGRGRGDVTVGLILNSDPPPHPV